MENLELSEMENLKEILFSVGHSLSYNEKTNIKYKALRLKLLQSSSLNHLAPEFIVKQRDLTDFIDFIEYKTFHGSERRNYIRAELEPIFEKLEHSLITPSDIVTSQTLDSISNQHIQNSWEKALERRTVDPEGAITSARTLIENVLKHILDMDEIPYPEKADLPELYKLVSKHLNLAPGDHHNEIFKQILSGYNNVVSGLGAVRNRFGDAHGKNIVHARPDIRHAELAVNLAGTMASFLIQTHEHCRSKETTVQESSSLNSTA